MLRRRWWKIWDDLKYILKMSRPRFWFYLAGPALIGLVYGTPGELLSLKNFAIFLYFLVPANIMLYGINDFFDRDIDEDNPKKGGRETSYNSSKTVNTVVGASVLASIPLVLILPERTYSLMLIFLFLSYQYSAPPLRFKARPFLDSISNGLYIMPFLITYSYASGSLPPLPVIAGGWLWTMGMHTFSAIPDIEPDRENNVKTTATLLGRSKSYVYVTAVWLASAASMSSFDPKLGLLFGVYPVLSSAVYLTGMKDSRAYWKFPVINTLTGMVITMYGLWVVFIG